MTRRPGREERARLLAVAETDELVELADSVLGRCGRLEVVRPPEVGCVATQVVDPVEGERFLLGDVLACQAEVSLAGVRGWAMRLGDDRAAVLAAAVCDAAAQIDGAQIDGAQIEGARAGTGAEVDALCARVAARLAERDAAEWAALALTVVEFEELR